MSESAITPSNRFDVQSVIGSVSAGLLIGVTEVIIALSFGSLVFSGELAEYKAQGLGLALMSASVICILVPLLTSAPGSIGSVQENTTIVLALLAADVSRHLVDTPNEILPTIMVALAAASVTSGVLLFLVGRFRLGRVVRYIPFPVVGGFLAGTGWLLVIASFGIMTGNSLTIENIPIFMQPDQLLLWVPGVMVALVLFFGLRLIKHSLAFPGLLILLIALLHIGLLVAGISISEGLDRGLLLSLADGFGWQPIFLPSTLSNVHLHSILVEFHHAPVIFALAAISLLLNLQGIEANLRSDIEADNELRKVGITNVLSGLMGGFIGYHSVSLSRLNIRITGNSRIAGVIVGLVCLSVLFLGGATVLQYFPIPLLGGIILFLGLDFLAEWVIAAYPRFSRVEYGVLLVILIIIAASDFLIGVAAGLVIMVIIFAFNYSRIDAIHHELTGLDLRSSLKRNNVQDTLLDEWGDEIHIIELQGYIFFGSVSNVIDHISDRLDRKGEHPLQILIIDFMRVRGLDSSAAQGFSKLRTQMSDQDIKLVLTGPSESIQQSLQAGGIFAEPDPPKHFVTLDEGLEWSEDHIIEAKGAPALAQGVGVGNAMLLSGLTDAFIVRLLEYLEPLELRAGDFLIQRADTDRSIFFVESGKLSVYLDVGKGSGLRVLSLSNGSIVGELAAFTDEERTASVIADTDCSVYRLTPQAVAEMEEQNPDLAIEFHKYVARQLAQRLSQSNRSIQALRR